LIELPCREIRTSSNVYPMKKKGYILYHGIYGMALVMGRWGRIRRDRYLFAVKFNPVFWKEIKEGI